MHLKENMSAFVKEFEGWRKDAQKAGRWFLRVEEGAESFTRKRHDSGRCRAAERHAKPAAAPSSVGISKRSGGGRRGGRGEGRKEGGGREGVLAKSLRSGSGHH